MSVGERDWEQLGRQVKSRREYLGLGQAGLGVSDLTVRKLEQGHGEGLRAKTLRQIEQSLHWGPGTADRVLDGTATTEDLLGGFGVLWFQNVSGAGLVVERPVPDADSVPVESMGIVQVVGAVSRALAEEYRTEHHDHPRSWSTSQWKLIKNEQRRTVEAYAGVARATVEPPNIFTEGQQIGDRARREGNVARPGAVGGDAVARMSVELLGQLVLQPGRTPAEERLIHSLIAVVAEWNGASVAYTTGTASITMTSTDPDTGIPRTQTLHASGDVSAR